MRLTKGWRNPSVTSACEASIRLPSRISGTTAAPDAQYIHPLSSCVRTSPQRGIFFRIRKLSVARFRASPQSPLWPAQATARASDPIPINHIFASGRRFSTVDPYPGAKRNVFFSKNRPKYGRRPYRIITWSRKSRLCSWMVSTTL